MINASFRREHAEVFSALRSLIDAHCIRAWSFLRFCRPLITVHCSLLLLGGCASLDSSPPYQPAKVVMLQPQAKSANFKNIRQGLEAALKAERQGDAAGFLQGMEKAKTDAEKFLSSASKYKVSDKTVYQFLADRLADEPAFPDSLDGAQLAKLEAGVRAQCSEHTAWNETTGAVVIDLNELLDPGSIRSRLEGMLSDWGEADFAVDDVLVRHVGYFLKFYALCDSDKTNRIFERSRKYLPYVQEVFAKHNLHEDIAFAVPFVESGFTTSALSVAGALGMFQFMPVTARDYGLCVDAIGAGGDERLDWEKTASAAARYLVRNRNVFGSNVLALGSYHHGSLKVMQVLLRVAERSKVRSFRPIFEHGELEPYSREYIPQCLAAACLYRFMKQSHAGRLANEGIHYENIREALPVKELAAHYKNLLANNKDLTHADRIYCYASTGGYALITRSNVCGSEAVRFADAKEKHGERAGQPGEGNEICRVPSPAAETAQGETDDNDLQSGPGTRQDKDPLCNIIYTFQKGNSLAELAREFGVDLHTVLAHPINWRLKERYPRDPSPGDMVVIPRLASTTTIVSSGGPGPDAKYSFCTSQGQTLREISQTVADAFQSSAEQGGGTGGTGKNLTPELILYWNRDHLPVGIGVEDPLPAGISLFIISDFRKEEPPNAAKFRQEQPGRAEGPGSGEQHASR